MQYSSTAPQTSILKVNQLFKQFLQKTNIIAFMKVGFTPGVLTALVLALCT